MYKKVVVFAIIALLFNSCSTETLIDKNLSCCDDFSFDGDLVPSIGINLHYSNEYNDVTLGDEITVEITTNNFEISHNPTIWIKNGNDDFQPLVPSNVGGNEVCFYAFKPGKNVIYCEIDSLKSEECEFEVIFPDASLILADNSAKTDELWNATMSDSDNGTRREYGCEIGMLCESDDLPVYSISDYLGDIDNNCDPGSKNDIHLEVKDFFDIRSNRGGHYTCLLYHTHPSLIKCPQYVSRITGPSTIDQQTAKETQVPFMVDDYDGPEVKGGQDIRLSHAITNAGIYDRREILSTFY